MNTFFSNIIKVLLFSIMLFFGQNVSAFVDEDGKEIPSGKGDTIAQDGLIAIRKVSDRLFEISSFYSGKKMYVNVDRIKGETYLRIDGCKEIVRDKNDKVIDTGLDGTLYFSRRSFQKYLNYLRSIRYGDYPVPMGDFGGELFYLNGEKGKLNCYTNCCTTGIGYCEYAYYDYKDEHGNKGRVRHSYTKYSIEVDFVPSYAVGGMYVVFQCLGLKDFK